MSKQATQSSFSSLNGLSLDGGLSNGWKDMSSNSSNAFDIRLPQQVDSFIPSQNTMIDDVFGNDSFPSKLLGGDLLNGILGEDSNDFEDTPVTNKKNNSSASSAAIGQTNSGSNLENIWSCRGSGSESSILGNGATNNPTNNSTGDYSSAFAPFSNNEGLGFLRRSSSFNKDEKMTTITKGGNESSKVSSGVESPLIQPLESSTNQASSSNLGFIETAQLINQRINSNEGWGKKPIRQDTPWMMEGSQYAPRRDEVESQPQQPTPQPESSGPFWDQNARIANCSESDRNFGVWTEPGRANAAGGLGVSPGMGVASGVGLWKNSLNTTRGETPSGQWTNNDPGLALLAAVAQRLSEDQTAKPKWTSQPPLPIGVPNGIVPNVPGWEDKTAGTGFTPWNSAQRVDNNSVDYNNPMLQQLINLGIPLESAQKLIQNTENKDNFNSANNNANKLGGFDSTRGRPLFPQKAHNLHIPNTIPQPFNFNQPPNRMDFGQHQQQQQHLHVQQQQQQQQQQQMLHNNLFMSHNATASNGLTLPNPQQDNAMVSAQRLLLALHLQQQQQQHQQQQQQQPATNNNADLAAMMMMMAEQHSKPGDNKEAMLSQMINNMRMDGKKDPSWWMNQQQQHQQQQPLQQQQQQPNNNNNSSNMDENNFWNLQTAAAAATAVDESSLFMPGSNNNNNNNNNNMLFNNNNNIRLSSWQQNKQLPNTANVAYNWILIKHFNADIASLNHICQQNRAIRQFCGAQSNSILIYFPTTDDAMKAKASFTLSRVQSDLLDNNTANRELQSGLWAPMPTMQLHHPRAGMQPWNRF